MTNDNSQADGHAWRDDKGSGATFPDLTGEWSMLIDWNYGASHGRTVATAIIEQNAGKISMEVHSTGSDSHTLLAQFGREGAGSPVLHYIYEVDPKAGRSDAVGPYKGAAILRFYSKAGELRGNYWTSQRSTGHFTLTRKTQMRKAATLTQTVDVVLITALKEEFDAAKSVLSAATSDGDGVPEWTNRDQPSNAPHLTGTFCADEQPLFTIALARPTRMGANRTGHLASVLVERLGPRWLVMCGVCAGNPKDLALGDVVASELTYQYDEGKLEKDGFTGDHRQSPVEDDWVRATEEIDVSELPSYGPANDRDARFWLLERLYGGDDPKNHPARARYFPQGRWKATVEQLIEDGLIVIDGASLHLTSAGTAEVQRSLILDVDPPTKLPFAIKPGPIASGNVVVKDGLTWDMLRRMGVKSVAGLEMEAAVIGEVARGSGVERWIVIKGVMDHADPKKDDRFKPFAARASAEVLRQLLVKRARLRAPAFTGVSPPIPSAQTGRSVWRLRTIEGAFFDELRIALERTAERYKGVAELALMKAAEAYAAADRAYEIAEQVRIELGASLSELQQGSLHTKVTVLRAGEKSDARSIIAKIWDSHDEYLGEALDDVPDGLGVVRVYAISREHTPALRSSFAGQHQCDDYGPLGVYTFPNQAQFAGEWTAGHPAFGYREYLGSNGELACDFYLGPMRPEPNGLQPRWLPHGEGILVDAAKRHVRCAKIVDGKIENISVAFDF